MAAAYDAIAADGDGGRVALGGGEAMLTQLDGLGAADAREPALKAALMRQIGLLLCRTNHKALLESAVTRLLDAAKPATDKTDAAGRRGANRLRGGPRDGGIQTPRCCARLSLGRPP